MTVCVHVCAVYAHSGASNIHMPSTRVAPCTEPHSTWAQPSWCILAPFLTCAAKGHSAHGGQVDGVSLVVREELKPHIEYADEEQGTQGQEVTCGEQSSCDSVVSAQGGAPHLTPLPVLDR